MLRKNGVGLWGSVVNIKVNGIKSLFGVVLEEKGLKDWGLAQCLPDQRQLS